MKGNCGECDRRWICDINPDDCDEWPDPAPITNNERISAMTIEEKAEFFYNLAYARETPWSEQFSKKFCESCPATKCEVSDYSKPIYLHECEFSDGECPHGSDIMWWLQQPAEGDS